MSAVTRRLLILAAPLLLACHPASDDVTPTDRDAEVEQAAITAKRVTISTDAQAVDRERIQTLTQAVEGLGDVHQARVKVKKTGEGDAHIVMELVGADLPTKAEIEEEIASFDFLASAAVEVEDMDPDTPMSSHQREGDKAKDPAVLEQEIVERMRADGVEGDIKVQVHDGEDGERRVEVKVEKHGTEEKAGAPDELAPEAD